MHCGSGTDRDTVTYSNAWRFVHVAATLIILTDPKDCPFRRVPVEEYRRFRADGFLIVRHLVPPEDIAELREHTEELMQGRLPEQHDGTLEAPPENLAPAEKAQHFLRIHMLHRKLALHERYMLHPRVLDVVQALIGPDVLALQTMLFLKPPGGSGQGWHQDTYYIPTHPDT
ncbi:MAG: phytanoyl-CoA dioxygenase family protein, partial [Burkholderiales bacterium]|nr:phytanoyl-CoA dioxygenase family protein [Burkholderiales bacterium]